MKETDPLNLHTGAGEPSALLCAGCSALLKPTEVYACSECLEFWRMTDPNGLMGVDDD